MADGLLRPSTLCTLATVPRGSHTCRLPSVTQNHHFFFFLRDLLHYPEKLITPTNRFSDIPAPFPTLFKPEAYSLFFPLVSIFSPTTHSQTNGDARDTREGVVHRNRNIAPRHASNFQQSKAGYFHHTLALRFRRESVIIIIYHEKGTTTTKTRGTTRNPFLFFFFLGPLLLFWVGFVLLLFLVNFIAGWHETKQIQKTGKIH